MSVILLLVGESGVGKTTVANKLQSDYGLKQLYSYTTRPPRYEGETGHVFVSDEEFDKLTDIVGYTEFDGHRYCATADQVDSSDIYVIDPAGVDYFRDKYHGNKKVCVVKISVSHTECYRRMVERGDSDVDAFRRLAHDKIAFDNVRADKYVLNYDLDHCVKFIFDIFEKENK